MFYYKMIIKLIIILLAIKLSKSDNIKIEIELSGPYDSCAKYTARGNEFLEIAHARIFQTNELNTKGAWAIRNNILCNKKKTISGQTYTFECEGTPNTNATHFHIILVVQPKKQMLSGPIDYRYNSKLLHLVEDGFLDPKKLENEKFHYDQHILVKKFSVTGLYASKVNAHFDGCQFMFPKRLIADHGIYFWSVIGDNNDSGFFERMYYEPTGVNDVLQYRFGVMTQ